MQWRTTLARKRRSPNDGHRRSSVAKGYYVLVTITFAVLFIPVSSERAAAITRDELLRSCKAVTSSVDFSKRSSFDIPASGLPCWYYMSAVQNMSIIVDQNGEHALRICPPSSSSLADYVQAFVLHERQQKNAGDNDNPAPDVLMSLAKRFPCKEADL